MNNTESSMIVASRDEDGTWIDLDERGLIHRVIAWMPLPEPYTESESSDE